MSKLTAGQKVMVHFPYEDAAQSRAIHVIDDKQEIFGEVVYVHESGNVNVVVKDQVGTSIPLLDIPTTKEKEGIYVSANK